MPPVCIVCGLFSKEGAGGHRPRQIGKAFGGAGVADIQRRLDALGAGGDGPTGKEVLRLLAPSGAVVCTLKRPCYKALRRVLLEGGLYAAQPHRPRATEPAKLGAVGAVGAVPGGAHEGGAAAEQARVGSPAGAAVFQLGEPDERARAIRDTRAARNMKTVTAAEMEEVAAMVMMKEAAEMEEMEEGVPASPFPQSPRSRRAHPAHPPHRSHTHHGQLRGRRVSQGTRDTRDTRDMRSRDRVGSGEGGGEGEGDGSSERGGNGRGDGSIERGGKGGGEGGDGSNEGGDGSIERGGEGEGDGGGDGSGHERHERERAPPECVLCSEAEPCAARLWECPQCKVRRVHVGCLRLYARRGKCVCPLPGLCVCDRLPACPFCRALLPKGFSGRARCGTPGCTLPDHHGGPCSDPRLVPGQRPQLATSVAGYAMRRLTAGTTPGITPGITVGAAAGTAAGAAAGTAAGITAGTAAGTMASITAGDQRLQAAARALAALGSL